MRRPSIKATILTLAWMLLLSMNLPSTARSDDLAGFKPFLKDFKRAFESGSKKELRQMVSDHFWLYGKGEQIVDGDKAVDLLLAQRRNPVALHCFAAAPILGSVMHGGVPSDAHGVVVSLRRPGAQPKFGEPAYEMAFCKCGRPGQWVIFRAGNWGPTGP